MLQISPKTNIKVGLPKTLTRICLHHQKLCFHIHFHLNELLLDADEDHLRRDAVGDQLVQSCPHLIDCQQNFHVKHGLVLVLNNANNLGQDLL